ncbi:MAG: MotA/TolQ/ExbB proton channel family protein, partial [Planctomycetes bacterium]|nr:MotA/TolQ/ExbB proton channel family protein [Planctomycetota bacterium]
MTATFRSSRRWVRWVFVGLLLAAILPAIDRAAAQAPGEGEAVVEVAGVEGKVTPVSAEAPIPTRNLWSIVRGGGLLMIPIAICSLILLAVIFERIISLRRGRVIPKPFVTRFMQQIREGELDRKQAFELCTENGSPVADVLAGAVRKWGRPAVEVEQAVIDAGERTTNGLRKYLRVFNGVATVTPLLGLLGTVVGMIRAFNAIATADAMGRPELLATGISQALLTTAAGLTVAIPALILYMYFVSRVDRLIIDIDALGQELVNLISAEELQDRGPKPAASKSRHGQRRENAA